MEFWSYELDNLAKREKKNLGKKGEMSANEWRFNDSGSCEPRKSSLDVIFAAYHDYRESQQWN